MKAFKISFALIVAVVVIAIVFATNVNALSGKVVTGCWRANAVTMQVRDLVNPSSPNSTEIFSPVYNLTSCGATLGEHFVLNKRYLRVASGNPIADLTCLRNSEVFCCLVLEEISSLDPLNADVPAINLGDGAKKYQISEVRCKPF